MTIACNSKSSKTMLIQILTNLLTYQLNGYYSRKQFMKSIRTAFRIQIIQLYKNPITTAEQKQKKKSPTPTELFKKLFIKKFLITY